MKQLNAKGLKILKVCHLLFAFIWLVSIMAMGAVLNITARSGDELFALYQAVRVIDDILLIPAAILTVVTAIVYGLFSNWGFFKHRWMTVKWVVSVAVIVAGTFYFNPIVNDALAIADSTRDAALANPVVERNTLIAFIGTFIQGASLVFLVIISVFKPWKAKNRK